VAQLYFSLKPIGMEFKLSLLIAVACGNQFSSRLNLAVGVVYAGPLQVD